MGVVFVMIDDADGLMRHAAGVISIVVGLAVAVATGGVVSAFLNVAIWAGIHAGLSESTLVMFSLGAFAFQLTLGLLAGWGTYHFMGKRGRVATDTAVPLSPAVRAVWADSGHADEVRGEGVDVGRQRQALVVSLTVGLVVAVATAFVAFSFLLAASWARIHGGYGQSQISAQITMMIFSLGAAAAPPALGLLADWGTYRLMAKRGRRDRETTERPQ